VSNCSSIDLEDNSSVSLTIYFKLTKPSNQALGTTNVKALLKYSSSSNGNEKGSYTVLSNSWGNNNTEFYGQIPINVSENEIQVNGSSIFIKSITDSGVESNSCEYSLEKDEVPSFTLSPTSINLSCGDTSSRTFTVTPSNIPSGANVTYQWSHSGWSLVSSTDTSRTLQPNSGTSLPSNVSVTPYINGVVQSTETCSVNRSPFTTQATISGNSSLCSTATYSVNNLPAGVSVTSWSCSFPDIATISGNGNQATLTATGNGTVAITATLTNACGQTKVITKANISVGAPNFSPYPEMSGDSNPMVGEYKTYAVTGAEGATSYSWYFDVGNGVTGTNVDGWEILSYGYQNKSINVRVGNPGTTVVVCKATNSCGNRIKYKYVTVRSPSDPCGELRLSSNPMKSGNSTNRIIYPPIDPCDDPYGNKTANSKKTVEIFNQYGEKVYSQSQTENDFYVNDLKKGFYIVKSQTVSGKTMTEKLIVE